MLKEEQANAPRTRVEAIMGGAIRASDVAIGCLILAAIALNFSNVVARYVFASAISWAEEVLIFLSVWSVFLGAAASAWEDAHLRMDLVLAIVPSAWRKSLTVFGWVVAVLVGGVVLFASWQVVSMMARFGQKSTSADIPMVLPHSAITIGFALIVIATVARACVDLMKWRRERAKRDAGGRP